MCRLGPEASALPEATHRHRDIRKGSLARVTSALLSGAYVSRAFRGMHVLRPSRNDSVSFRGASALAKLEN